MFTLIGILHLSKIFSSYCATPLNLPYNLVDNNYISSSFYNLYHDFLSISKKVQSGLDVVAHA
jgi:hypothetical protein